MSYLELVAMLETLGIPVAYDHFDDAVTLPFITINDVGNVPLYADDINYWDSIDYDINYHFKLKNPEEENRLEELFKDNHLLYTTTTDIWIEDEKRYLKTYEVNINDKK